MYIFTYNVLCSALARLGKLSIICSVSRYGLGRNDVQFVYWAVKRIVYFERFPKKRFTKAPIPVTR